MAGKETDQKEKNLGFSRRKLFQGLMLAGGAVASEVMLSQITVVEAQTTPEAPLKEGVQIWFVPYLPGTEKESIEHVKNLEQKDQWDKAVFPRVFIPVEMNAEVDPENRYASMAKAVAEYAKGKGWGDNYTAYEQVFSYPVTIGASEEDLLAGKDVKAWFKNKQVSIDALQLSSYTVAVSPIDAEKMVIYSNPGEVGQIRARLIDGVTEGEVTIAFAKNKNVDTLSDPNSNAVPAVHIKGYPGAKVRVKCYLPTDETLQKNDASIFKTIVVDAVLSENGDLAVHLPKESDLYKGMYSPTISIQLQTFASNPNGETEIEFRLGSDDMSPGKNRIIETQLTT